MQKIEAQYYQTYLWDKGKLIIYACKEEICWLEIQHLKDDYQPFPKAEEMAVPVLKEALAQLAAYFKGRLKTFDIPLKLKGTDFQRRVWQYLGRIPYGEVVSYQQVAEAASSQAASQAAGQAVGANPVPLIIPCHRVIRKDGSIGGFGSGLDFKRYFLKIEGVLTF